MAQPSPKEFQPYRKLQSNTEAELRRILEATAKSIERRVAKLKPGVGGQVRAAQLGVTLAAINKLLRQMWIGRINPLVVRAIEESLKASEDAIETMTRVAYAGLPEQAAQTLVDGLRASGESGLKSDAARRVRELSPRVYRQQALDDGKVEQVIRTGLISGLSAKELARDAYKYVSPNTKGGASYAAMRLARTEINNAFHERQVEGAKRPGVKAVQWNLSGSHRVPDLCNVYADHGGNGQWDPDAIPDKPHPQCFCYLTYITIPPEEFRKQLEAGEFDDEIDRRTRENMARLGQPVGDLRPKGETQQVQKITPGKAKIGMQIKGSDGQWHIVDTFTKAPGGGSRTGGGRGGQYTFRDADNNIILRASPNENISVLNVTAPEPKNASDGNLVLTGDAVHDLVPKGLFKRGTLTPKQRKEFNTYSTGWFTVINNGLRGGYISIDPDYKRDLQTVEIMRTAFDKSVLSEDIQVWRGMYNSKLVFGKAWDNDLTGFEWDDLGFGSTTTQEDIVDLFNLGDESRSSDIAGDTKMKVSVPAGVKAVQISSATRGSKDNGPQAEIALQEGLRWRVVKDHGFSPEGRRELEVTVAPIGNGDE